MDPFTISTGVLACISISLKVLVGLKQLKANVGGESIGSASIDVLSADISGLRKVLQSMEDAFQDTNDEQAVRETGHRGAHWRSLRRCLNDGHWVLSDFDEMLFDLSKKVKVLDPSRMKSRLQSAAARFVLLGQQLQAYKDAFRVSLEVIALLSPVSSHKSTSQVESPVMGQDIHRLAANVDTKIQAIRDAVAGNRDAKTADTMSRLKQCVASAVAVVSQVSTLPGSEVQSKSTTSLPSSSKHEGVMEWISKSSVDAARLQTPPSEDSGFETTPTKLATLQLPVEKAARPAAVPTAPPTPDASLPSPTDSHTETSDAHTHRTQLAHHHPPNIITTQRPGVPGPMIMYMSPVGWHGQNQNHPNSAMSSVFPVQVIYGPPPAGSSRQRMSLQQPVMPPRPTPSTSSPTTRHSHRPTLSTSALPRTDQQPEQRAQPLSQPTLQPAPKVQQKPQQRGEQPPQLQPEIEKIPPSLTRPQPSYGNSEKGSDAGSVGKHKQSKLQKQPKASGKAGVQPKGEDGQQAEQMYKEAKNRISVAQPPSARRRSQNPFTGLRRLMPGSSENLPRRQKLCFVGDSCCGKTCLLTGATKGTFPENYEPTTFENYVSDVEVRGVGRVELEIWDTAGQEDYDSLRSLSYPDSHALVLCFSIGDPPSYCNVFEKWLPEATRFCPAAPIFVIACKQDLRFDHKTIGRLQRSGQLPLTTAEGLAAAGRINARYYIETSAKSSYGIQNLLALIAEETLKAPRAESSVNAGKRFEEDAHLINEERRKLRASGEILTPREKEYASKYYRILDEPNSTVWKLYDEQSVEKVANASRSSFFRKTG